MSVAGFPDCTVLDSFLVTASPPQKVYPALQALHFCTVLSWLPVPQKESSCLSWLHLDSYLVTASPPNEVYPALQTAEFCTVLFWPQVPHKEYSWFSRLHIEVSCDCHPFKRSVAGSPDITVLNIALLTASPLQRVLLALQNAQFSPDCQSPQSVDVSLDCTVLKISLLTISPPKLSVAGLPD